MRLRNAFDETSGKWRADRALCEALPRLRLLFVRLGAYPFSKMTGRISEQKLLLLRGHLKGFNAAQADFRGSLSESRSLQLQPAMWASRRTRWRGHRPRMAMARWKSSGECSFVRRSIADNSQDGQVSTAAHMDLLHTETSIFSVSQQSR